MTLKYRIIEGVLCIIAGLALLAALHFASLAIHDNGMVKTDVTAQHIKNIKE